MKALRADFWSGLALGGLGAYIIVVASRWEYMGQDGPGPGFFPLWYGIVMAVLSLMLMVSSVTDKSGSTNRLVRARAAHSSHGRRSARWSPPSRWSAS
jgi:putative tricarboxylic transport membrane protein